MKDPKRLVNNDDLAGTLMASARHDAPSPRARQRAEAALGVSVGIAGVSSGTAAAGATVTGVAKVAVAGAWIKIGAGFVTALAIGGGIAVTRSAEPSTPPVAVPSAVLSVASPTSERPELSAPPTIVDPAPPSASASAEPPPVVAAEPPVATRAPTSPPPRITASVPPSVAPPAPESEPAVAAETESPLSRELKALDLARSALSRGDATAALASLDEHDRAFPTGPLRTEADILRVEALLADGDANAAKTLAKALVARAPSGPHAQRLRSLAGEEK